MHCLWKEELVGLLNEERSAMHVKRRPLVIGLLGGNGDWLGWAVMKKLAKHVKRAALVIGLFGWW